MDDEMMLLEEDEELFLKLDDDLDFSFALALQQQFEEEAKESEVTADSGKGIQAVPEKQLSVVDAEWETLDPNPDIHKLFIQFNYEFFWGSLESVEVRWSPRMTLCAGVCCYEGRGGLCSVRLSQPLLKFRPRRDLVETLLHEMIHAYLFVTQNNRDHDAHGPEFLKHMNRINASTGAKISVYHSFHDEVDYQRKHWWKCNGPCQYRRPYFGIVKRAMNRAPSPRDPWWADHQAKCGGQFTKIKEPENFKVNKQASKKHTGSGSSTKDIRNFFGGFSAEKSLPTPAIGHFPKPATFLSGSTSSNSAVVTVDKIKSKDEANKFVPFSGKGHVLGSGPVPGSSSQSGSSIGSVAASHFKSKNVGNKDVPNSAVGHRITGHTSQDRNSMKGSRTAFATRGGGSRTVVINRTPKAVKGQQNSPGTVNKTPVAFSGVGHKLVNTVSPGTHKPSMSPNSVQQRSLDSFLSGAQNSNLSHLNLSHFKGESSKRNIARSANGSSVKKSCNQQTLSSLLQPQTVKEEDPQTKTVACPVCALQVREQDINHHLDECLQN